MIFESIYSAKLNHLFIREFACVFPMLFRRG